MQPLALVLLAMTSCSELEKLQKPITGRKSAGKKVMQMRSLAVLSLQHSERCKSATSSLNAPRARISDHVHLIFYRHLQIPLDIIQNPICLPAYLLK